MNIFKFVFTIFVFVFSYALSAQEYKRVTEPYHFEFPADHGAHPAYQNEWWYLTLNLKDKDNNPYGVQFTLFRSGKEPFATKPNTWRISQLYMAHATITSAIDKQFIFEERYSRDSFGLAGVTTQPFNVWLNDWSLASEDSQFIPLSLKLKLKSSKVNIELSKAKPIVLHGDNGLSQKAPGRGNASYYYTIPRLQAKGTINLNNKDIDVEGTGWFDREWSTSVLGKEQSGWDWFALKFDDNTELMIYFMRRIDQQLDKHSYAVFINKDGDAEKIAPSKIKLQSLSTWIGPDDKSYGTQWQIQIPSKNMDINVQSILDEQFPNGAIPYWEGAVNIKGSHTGSGFVEQFYAARRMVLREKTE